ncbi:MAG: hypothetical protein D3926_23640 [Desulfobacteraceae bacterium]|nr:MAG: hypothetical protein D3926_23640 [Desulfobacteraceae bacterium]
MRKTIAISIIVLLTFMLVSVAFAKKKYRMKHQGYYILQIQSPKLMETKIGPINAHSGCGKKAKKKCAERGKDRMLKCFSKHAEGLTKNYAPLECTKKHGIDDYKIINLHKTIKKTACRKAGNPKSVVLSVYGKTSFVGSARGKVAKASQGKKLLIKNKKFNCR